MWYLQASKDLPAVQKMLEQAEAVSGYDILQLCLEGPKEKLDNTAYSQPALYIAGLAAAEKLRHDDPDVFSSCSAVAGLTAAKFPLIVVLANNASCAIHSGPYTCTTPDAGLYATCIHLPFTAVKP